MTVKAMVCRGEVGLVCRGGQLFSWQTQGQPYLTAPEALAWPLWAAYLEPRSHGGSQGPWRQVPHALMPARPAHLERLLRSLVAWVRASSGSADLWFSASLFSFCTWGHAPKQR